MARPEEPKGWGSLRDFPSPPGIASPGERCKLPQFGPGRRHGDRP